MAEMKPGQDPAIDYAALMGQHEAATTSTALALNKQLDAQESANSAEQVAQTAMGGANAVISNEANARAAATDAKVADIRATTGADPTLNGTLSSVWLQRMNDAAEKQYQSLDVIQKKQSATLLNDPLGFIMAQFTLPADIETHNYYNQQRQTAEEQLNEINSYSDNAVIAARRAQATTSNATAEAEATLATQKAAAAVAKLQADNAGNKIRGIVELNNLDDKQMSFLLQIHAAQNSDKSLAMQAQNHADMMKLRQDALDLKSEGKANMSATMEEYNAGARRMNKPVFQDITAFTRYFSANNKNPDFQNIWGQGQDILINGGNTDGIPVAMDAGHAALTYASGSTSGLKGDPAASFLVQNLDAVKSMPNAPKDREALAAAVKDRAVNGATASLREIRSGMDNIYAAPAPSVVLGAVKATSGPFIDSEIRPLVKGPETKLPDDVIFTKAVQFAASNGRGGINTAADDLVKYYNTAVAQNNALNQYREKSLPPQTSYNANINGAILNLNDPIAVRRALIMATTRQAIGESPAFATMLGQP
jgi:hypothetical protein